MAPSAELQKQEALLLPVVGLCPMFQMCWRPCSAVPGSWELTRAQLAAPQTVQSDVLSRRFRIIPTSLITPLRPYLTFSANLAGPCSHGERETWALHCSWHQASQMLVSKILGVKKEKIALDFACESSAAVLDGSESSIKQNWHFMFSVTTVCLSLGSLCISVGDRVTFQRFVSDCCFP